MYHLSFLISIFRFVDFVDVVAVAFIIYRFLLIIQGSRSYQILVGVLAISGIYWISKYYEFFSLEWLLGNFFDYLFIILIVLFQEQIKSALVFISGTKIFGLGTHPKFDQQIEEVVAATTALSRERTGALIVFEKKHSLQNYSMTGTRLESKIHSDIIYSIFQVKSPLHDGAIIIFNGLIQAAGCFLPLSKNLEIDRQYGTRHRAALGITEVSDAVVITVSEETGKINVCYEGIFYFVSNEESLRKNLRKFLLEIDSSQIEIVSKNE